MKSAEIVTTHNVVIQYDMAPVMLRIVSSILDIVIVFFYCFIVQMIFTAFMVGGYRFDDFNNAGVFLSYLFLIPGFFYSFFCEVLLGGQTIGKKALGIRVLSVSGENASVGDLFIRWVFRLPELIMSVGALGLLTSLSNHRGQRLGDIVANTIVIKLKPNSEFSITDILKIKSSKDYEPTYPAIVQMSDEDMLLIKNAMERLKKNSNDAHKDLVRQLAHKTSEKLGLSETPKKKLTFLKTALQDYIVLTRS